MCVFELIGHSSQVIRYIVRPVAPAAVWDRIRPITYEPSVRQGADTSSHRRRSLGLWLPLLPLLAHHPPRRTRGEVGDLPFAIRKFLVMIHVDQVSFVRRRRARTGRSGARRHIFTTVRRPRNKIIGATSSLEGGRAWTGVRRGPGSGGRPRTARVYGSSLRPLVAVLHLAPAGVARAHAGEWEGLGGVVRFAVRQVRRADDGWKIFGCLRFLSWTRVLIRRWKSLYAVEHLRVSLRWKFFDFCRVLRCGGWNEVNKGIRS